MWAAGPIHARLAVWITAASFLFTTAPGPASRAYLVPYVPPFVYACAMSPFFVLKAAVFFFVVAWVLFFGYAPRENAHSAAGGWKTAAAVVKPNAAGEACAGLLVSSGSGFAPVVRRFVFAAVCLCLWCCAVTTQTETPRPKVLRTDMPVGVFF